MCVRIFFIRGEGGVIRCFVVVNAFAIVNVNCPESYSPRRLSRSVISYQCMRTIMRRRRREKDMMTHTYTHITHTQEGSLEGRAVTHLNMCAILSQLNRHKDGLEHAKAAVLHCQKQLLSDHIKHKLSTHQDKHSLLTEKIVILGIAYHNLGVEEEFLQRYETCLQWYLKALQLAKEHIGNNEEITKTFRESYFAAKKQMKKVREQGRGRGRERPRSALARSGRGVRDRVKSGNRLLNSSSRRQLSRRMAGTGTGTGRHRRRR